MFRFRPPALKCCRAQKNLAGCASSLAKACKSPLPRSVANAQHTHVAGSAVQFNSNRAVPRLHCAALILRSARPVRARTAYHHNEQVQVYLYAKEKHHTLDAT